MVQLGVNIDHVATVRQARKTNEPDPIWAAALAELGGADGITIHLREDRRHIQQRDLRMLMESVAVPINLELACSDEVLSIACDSKPFQATLVPERREEVTTEGGLDVVSQREKAGQAVRRLKDAGIFVSLFLDPDRKQIEAGASLGADAIELHTGSYAHATFRHNSEHTQAELQTLIEAGKLVRDAGMTLDAGHGLTYRNVKLVAAIDGMHALNIGHSIVARALMVGFEQAVRDMKRLIEQFRLLIGFAKRRRAGHVGAVVGATGFGEALEKIRRQRLDLCNRRLELVLRASAQFGPLSAWAYRPIMLRAGERNLRLTQDW